MNAHGSSLAPDDIDNSEKDDPQDVDKMPVHRKNLHTQRVSGTNAAGEAEKQNDQEHDQADGDVEGVQADEGLVCGAEKVRRDGETLVVNQVMPFAAGAEEEEAAQQDGEEPGSKESSSLASLAKFLRKVNGDAAGEQADGEEDRRFQDFSRRGTREALSDVVDVSDNEDRKDRRFPDDEACHRDLAAIRKRPGLRDSGCEFAHSSVLSFIVAVRIFGMLEIPERAATLDRGDDGKIVGGRRRANGPFEGPSVPRIVACLRSFEIRIDHVADKDENGDRLDRGTDAGPQVPDFPASTRFVCVDTARHAEQAGDMHEIEGEVEANNEEPEMPFA